MFSQMSRKRAPAPKVAPPAGLVVGGEIQALCGKCKARTPHLVVAKIGVKPTRVECRTCKDTHAYKTVARTIAVTSNMTPEEAWKASMRRAQGEATAYSPTARYAVGARVSHKTFGEGVVARLASSTVCEVVFLERTVKLVMGALLVGGDTPKPQPGLRAVGSRSRRRTW
jgi:hypothetical protein